MVRALWALAAVCAVTTANGALQKNQQSQQSIGSVALPSRSAHVQHAWILPTTPDPTAAPELSESGAPTAPTIPTPRHFVARLFDGCSPQAVADEASKFATSGMQGNHNFAVSCGGSVTWDDPDEDEDPIKSPLNLYSL